MSAQLCTCGHTHEQHSQWSSAAACLACTRCIPGDGPHVLTKCECTAYTPKREDKSNGDSPKPVVRVA